VIYARQCVHPEDAGDPTKWKPAAFGAAVEQRRADIASEESGGKRPSDASLDAVSINIVSIGDGIYERVAARVCAEPQDLVKTIKFVDSPSITQLRRQLRLTAEILPEVVSSSESRSIGLRTALDNVPPSAGPSPAAPVLMQKPGPGTGGRSEGNGVLRRVTGVASRARRKIEL
jgi:hypothetical protein